MPIHLRVESLVQGMMMEITKLTMINDKSDKNKKDRKDKNMQQICSAVVWSTNSSPSWMRCESNEEENWNLIKLDIDQQV